MKIRLLPLLLVTGLGLGACIGDENDAKEDENAEDKADRWDYRNDPARFQISFNYRLADLPQSGEAAQIPWADDYWSYYNDSINHRWRGQDTLSPAELYDVAFNGWSPPEGYMSLRPRADRAATWDAAYYNQLGPLANDVHNRRGNAQMVNGRDDDGDGEIDECDSTDCDGVEFWWGVCHAWAPAAVMEPEPIRAVEHNGQIFLPSDIKALIMIVYDSPRALMLGGRCNARDVDRDEFGRSTMPECQDVNAGAFHVVVTNMLGIHSRSFDEDRTYDYQVWNQPVRDYRVTSLREGLTAAEAMAVLGRTEDTYVYNRDAVGFAEVRMDLRYITESSPSEQPTLPIIDRYTRTDRYHYILELDAEGNVIGGEWGPSSQSNHPDFLWLPTAHGTAFRTITYENVRLLLEMSRREEGGGPTPEGQVFEVRPELAIPDNDPTGATATLTVDGQGTISSLRVAVDIAHTYIGDLTLTLVRNGQRILLQRHQGGSARDLSQVFTVSELDGQSIGGEWALHVTDDAARDVGTIRRFALVAVLEDGGGSGGTLTFANDTALGIPDNDQTGVTSTVAATGNGMVRDLRVRVNIEHTWIGDLVVELVRNGQVRTLHNRTGGSTDDIVTEYQVTEFNGTPVAGTWALRVRDLARRDTGTLRDWTLVATVD